MNMLRTWTDGIAYPAGMHAIRFSVAETTIAVGWVGVLAVWSPIVASNPKRPIPTPPPSTFVCTPANHSSAFSYTRKEQSVRNHTSIFVLPSLTLEVRR